MIVDHIHHARQDDVPLSHLQRCLLSAAIDLVYAEPEGLEIAFYTELFEAAYQAWNCMCEFSNKQAVD